MNALRGKRSSSGYPPCLTLFCWAESFSIILSCSLAAMMESLRFGRVWIHRLLFTLLHCVLVADGSSDGMHSLFIQS